MKILLAAINAKYIHSNPAVYGLRAYAAEFRDRIEIAEFTINQTGGYILEEIYKRKPDVLCFSVYIWNLSCVEEAAREFHKLCPQVPIWVGGPEVSYETDTFLKEHPWAEGIMVGEGEESFRSLCALWCQSPEAKSPGQIPGLVFRRGAGICHTGMGEPLDMSSLPFAYEKTEDFANRIIYYESSRGCPFSCSYCLSSVDKHLRFRREDLVKKELQFFLDHGVAQVKFVDRTFNCHHRHAMEIWNYILEHDNGITNFHFEISADLLNEEELELLERMRPGLVQLEIGVQSTNLSTIQEIHRTMDLGRLKQVVKRIRSCGNIHQHLDLIAGLPEEGYESFRTSFDEIYALQPNQLQLGFLKVLKGSYMYEHAQDYGLIYLSRPPYEVLASRWLSYGELLAIKRVEEMLEIYYNSGQYEMTMRLVMLLEESMFDFFLALGSFYERKGYLAMSHSRIRRCEILLEFLKEERQKWPAELLRESLLFDLYYRENCKSRPAWAADPADFRDMTHKYCRRGKLTHLEPFHYRFPDKTDPLSAPLPIRQETPLWVLFDYENRDPLDHQAEVTYIS